MSGRGKGGKACLHIFYLCWVTNGPIVISVGSRKGRCQAPQEDSS